MTQNEQAEAESHQCREREQHSHSEEGHSWNDLSDHDSISSLPP